MKKSSESAMIVSNAPKKKFGHFMTGLRLRAQKRQKDISEALGYSSAQYVSNWERGVTLPPLKAVPVIAEIYGCRPRLILEQMRKCEHDRIDLEYKAVVRTLRSA